MGPRLGPPSGTRGWNSGLELGCQVQILGMSIVTLIFALLGFLSPAHRRQDGGSGWYLWTESQEMNGVEVFFGSNGLIWVNYNDLTATSLESWLVREIIPKWP